MKIRRSITGSSCSVQAPLPPHSSARSHFIYRRSLPKTASGACGHASGRNGTRREVRLGARDGKGVAPALVRVAELVSSTASSR
jgi:hypothetical protein